MEIGDIVHWWNDTGWIGIITNTIHRQTSITYSVLWFGDNSISELTRFEIEKVS